MRVFLCLAALAVVHCSDNSNYTPPKVQVYSHDPAEYGVENILICHCSGFHPPDITVQLIGNGEELPETTQTDLAFKGDWRFHVTKNAAFKPMRGDEYHCRVTHGGKVKDYAWEPNM